MDTVPPTAPAHKTWITLIRDLVRRRKWTYALFFGATVGTAVGVLNLVAVAQQRQKLEDTFELLNLPMTSMIPDAQYRFGPLVGIGYWPIIGMFLASLICFTGDRKCRRTLLFGLAGGILVGGLNWLAIAKRWSGLEDFLDHTINPLKEAINLRMWSPRAILYWQLTCVVYWVTLGLIFASVFCVIQTVKKRRAAKTRVSEK